MNDEELASAINEVRNLEGSNFDKGYAGAPLFCKLEGIGPQDLLKIIAIDLSKPDTDVEFNEGAQQWCAEQIAEHLK